MIAGRAGMTKNRDMDFRIFARGAGTLVTCGEGEIIFREGEPSSAMYIVLDGAIEIASHGRPVETIRAGRALGFVSVLDQRPRATTARALEPSELAVMDYRKFRYMVDEVPNFAWYVMQEMSHRLRVLNAAIEARRGGEL
jgi:CRP/FNR family transcriptional regulator, cyclic AMP receptor protein